MRNLKAAVILAGIATLAGCNAEYDSSEVNATSNGGGVFNRKFTGKESGDLVSGTIIYKRGEVVTRKVGVKDGLPHGEWIDYFENGDVEQSVTLEQGKIVGIRKTFCGSKHDQLKWSHDHSSEIELAIEYDCGTGLVVKETRQKEFHQVGENKEWRVVNGKQFPVSVRNYDADGKQDGISESYTDDGYLQSSMTYKAGEQEGPFKEYVFFQDGSVRLRREGVNKGWEILEEKTYETDKRYPDGTLERNKYINWDGGSVVEHYDDNKVRVGFTKGDSKNEQMIMSKILSKNQPTQADFDNLTYLLETTKVDLNKVYGHIYMVQKGDHLITAMAEPYYDKLISMGLDPNGTDFDGSSRLLMCLQSPDACSFEHVLRLANDNLTAGVKSKHLFGETSASFFCKNLREIRYPKKYELFSALLKLDDVNKQNKAGETPLHQCMKQKDLTGAKILVAAGADLGTKNLDGFTPLHMAFVVKRGSRFNISWKPDIIKDVGEMAKGSTFSFNKALPEFDKSLKQIFLENGDAVSAKIADAFN